MSDINAFVGMIIIKKKRLMVRAVVAKEQKKIFIEKFTKNPKKKSKCWALILLTFPKIEKKLFLGFT